MTHLYASERYATSLATHGPPVYLHALETWALPRPIGSTARSDAMAPYPFTPLKEALDLSSVSATLAEQRLVSFVAVTDALQTEVAWLDHAFDFVRPFKTHYLIDRSKGEVRFSKHHRYEVRRARRVCETRITALTEQLDPWMTLYRGLIARHGLGESHDFSEDYFRVLAESSETTMIGAFVDETLVSAHLWVATEAAVYSHLAASSEVGYSCGASYAIYDHAISHFAGHQLIDLGGVAGAQDAASDGLARFKRGFANATRHNHVVGVVADPEAYRALCRERRAKLPDSTYFPLYRRPVQPPDQEPHVVG